MHPARAWEPGFGDGQILRDAAGRPCGNIGPFPAPSTRWMFSLGGGDRGCADSEAAARGAVEAYLDGAPLRWAPDGETLLPPDAKGPERVWPGEEAGPARDARLGGTDAYHLRALLASADLELSLKPARLEEALRKIREAFVLADRLVYCEQVAANQKQVDAANKKTQL